MASHDCQIIGTLALKDGVTEVEVIATLQAFLAEHSLDGAKELQEGGIELDEGILGLTLGFKGYGGYRNDSIQSLTAALAALVQGPGYLEVHDCDAVDPDARCVPYFIGGNEFDQRLARLNYWTEQMEVWIEPLVGRSGVQEAAQLLREMMERRLVSG